MADFDGFRIDTLKHVEHEFWQDFCPGIRQYTAGGAIPDPTQLDVPGAEVPPLDVPKQKFLMFGESFDGNDDLNGSYTRTERGRQRLLLRAEVLGLRRRVQERRRHEGDRRSVDAHRDEVWRGAPDEWHRRRRPRNARQLPRQPRRGALPLRQTVAAGAPQRAVVPADGGRHPLHLLRHRAGVRRRQRPHQPRAPVVERLRHRERDLQAHPAAHPCAQGLRAAAARRR